MALTARRRWSWTTPTLEMRTAAELKAELERGTRAPTWTTSTR